MMDTDTEFTDSNFNQNWRRMKMSEEQIRHFIRHFIQLEIRILREILLMTRDPARDLDQILDLNRDRERIHSR